MWIISTEPDYLQTAAVFYFNVDIGESFPVFVAYDYWLNPQITPLTAYFLLVINMSE